MDKKQAILIQFSQANMAVVAKDNLNKKPYKGAIFIIFVSNYTNLDERQCIYDRKTKKEIGSDPNSNQQASSMSSEFVWTNDRDNFRFIANRKSNKINVPSQVLHLSNLSTATCNIVVLQDFFKGVGDIIEFRPLNSSTPL